MSPFTQNLIPTSTSTKTGSITKTKLLVATLALAAAAGLAFILAPQVTTKLITASCSVSPTTMITIGQIAIWTASATGGNGTYTYSWSGTDVLSGTDKSVVKSYYSTGNKLGTIKVWSGTMSTTKSCSNFVTVSSTL